MKFTKIMILLFLISKLNYAQMNFKIINSKEAHSLTINENLVSLKTIDYNLCSVYKIDSQRYLIKPVFPFSNSLIVCSLEQIEHFINEKYFPDGNEQSSLYYSFRNQFEQIDFHEFKENKINELLEYIKHSTSKHFKGINLDDIDKIYEALRKTRTFQKYKLGFTFLLGELIIKNYEFNLKWCFIEKKSSLNPERSIALYDFNNEYIDLENRIFGKWGYQGLYTVINTIKNFKLNIQPPISSFYKKY